MYVLHPCLLNCCPRIYKNIEGKVGGKLEGQSSVLE